MTPTQVSRFLVQHISHTVGARAALLYQEIRRCLGLRGGRMIGSTKWIYKTMQELADRFGFSVRDIQRQLKRLVELGWLKRKQLEAKQYKRRYWYTFGEVDPFCPVRERQADAAVSDKPSGSSSCSKKRQSGIGAPQRQDRSAQQEQPYAIPDADATQKVIHRWDGMTFTLPPKTYATRSAPVGFGRTLQT